jgi:hypothetical protein
MAIEFSKPRRPSALPEHVLWTLHKGSHTIEARAVMTPIGPELRIYRDDTLLWSQTFRDGDGPRLSLLADQEQADFRAKGWSDAV